MATIEIDGKTLEAENGKMIIEVADDAGIYIPRFCYHKMLSVAANCRMCLVEVENGRKPVPACATPITEGMKVFTKSKEAIRSQKAVMEFLLINHPLDCPICDQGGECELQDISMGFGAGATIYEEDKRAVEDDNLGSLIATEMTRCIHCTRCVRFGDEVAGFRELGALGRGESMQIGTYIQHSVASEVSGNVIDLCPVGALTSKPYRFTARAWELTQHDGISIHDCLGTNIHLHSLDQRLMRVVPKENMLINEMWLSDRDRYSYIGINSEARAEQPKIKRNGQWEEVDWPTALRFVADKLAKLIKKVGAEQVAALASPSSTLEEMYLMQKFCRGLGIQNIDHRVQQTDFADESHLSLMPNSTLTYKDLETAPAIVLIGCNIQREVPLAGLRVRKAYRNGAKIYAINLVDYAFHFSCHEKKIVSPQELVSELMTVLLALTEKESLPEGLQKCAIGLKVDKKSKSIANALKQSGAALVTGAICENHPQAALIRTLVHFIAHYSGASTLRLTMGGNTAGAWLAGMVPHRTTAGKSAANPGLNVQAALESKLKGYLLMGLDPAYDFANPAKARQAIVGAEFVVLLSAYQDSYKDYADALLPIATFAETAGTYINVNQQWQTVKGALPPKGQARPAWKVWRVLGNLLQLEGFDYNGQDEVLSDIQMEMNLARDIAYSPYYPDTLPEHSTQLMRVGEWPLYRSDAIVRHADALQKCAGADKACVKMHPHTAKKLKLDNTATVSQGEIEITLPLHRDERIPEDVIWVANGMPETIDLGHSFASIHVKA